MTTAIIVGDKKQMKKIVMLIGFGFLALSFLKFYDGDAGDYALPMDQKSIIDFHAHVAGLGYGNSGCFVNKEMRDNFRFHFYLMAMGTSLDELERGGDQIIFKKIRRK